MRDAAGQHADGLHFPCILQFLLQLFFLLQGLLSLFEKLIQFAFDHPDGLKHRIERMKRSFLYGRFESIFFPVDTTEILQQVVDIFLELRRCRIIGCNAGCLDVRVRTFRAFFVPPDDGKHILKVFCHPDFKRHERDGQVGGRPHETIDAV